MAKRRKNAYIFIPERHRGGGHGFLKGLALLLVFTVLTGGILNYIADHQLSYETVKVTVTALPDDLENWTILQFSDLHGRELGERQGIIRNALGTVRVSSIVFTGDMLGKDGDMGAMMDLLALLPAETPKLFVPGDEDPNYLDTLPHGNVSALADWAMTLTEAGVTILDRPVLFTRGKKNNARIWFIPEYLYSLDLNGMETAYRNQLDGFGANLTDAEAAQKRVAEYQLTRVAEIREAVHDMKESDIQIAVSHTPISYQYAGEMMRDTDRSKVFSLRNAALVIAGHNCAGQWRIPGVGAIYSPEYGWFPDDRVLMGLEYLSGIPQYISPGLGASGAYPYMPGRLFNSPVVTCIALTSKMTSN